MHAMRKPLFSILAVIAVAPFFTLACDMLKKGDDAGVDVAAAPPTVAAVDAAPAPVDTTPPPPATPLGGNTAVPVKPVGDGGKPVPVADGGKPPDGGTAPTPTPTFTIPPIPGFDAGNFVPPNFFDGGFPKPPK
jgi:hypothetical protein